MTSYADENWLPAMHSKGVYGKSARGLDRENSSTANFNSPSSSLVASISVGKRVELVDTGTHGLLLALDQKLFS